LSRRSSHEAKRGSSEIVEAEGLAELHPERLVAAGQEEPLAIATTVEPICRVVAKNMLLSLVVDEVPRLQRNGRVEK